jgi:hypothetical protein
MRRSATTTVRGGERIGVGDASYKDDPLDNAVRAGSVRLESLTYANLAGGAANFCRVVGKFLGERLPADCWL